jgi:hypothetical protein
VADQLVLPTHLGEREMRPQDVQTPIWLYREASRRWGRTGFHLDVAATAANALAPYHFDEERSGLSNPWSPFAAKRITAERAAELHRAHAISAWQRAFCDPTVNLDTVPKPPWRVWNNPPFENAMPWVEKAHRAIEEEGVELVVQLLPGRPGTDWWHYAKRHGAEFHEIRGRVPFIYPEGAKGGNFEWNVLLIWSLPITVQDFTRKAP